MTFFVAIVAACADISSWIVQKNILDSLSKLQDFSVLIYLLLLLFGVYAVNQIFWALTFYFSQKYWDFVAQEYKTKALKKYHRVRYSVILDKKEGEVHEVISGWVESVWKVVDWFFGRILQNTLMIVFGLWVLWYVDIYIFVYFVGVFIPIFIYYSLCGMRKRIPNAKLLTDERDMISGWVVEYLSHIRDIKILWSEKSFVTRFSRKFLDIFYLGMRIEKSHHEMNFVQFLILIGSMCLVLLYTGFQILEGVLSIGTFLLVYHIFHTIRFALWGLVSMYRDFEECLIRIRKLLDFFLWNEEKIGEKLILKPFQTLEVKNLSYNYQTGWDILKKVDFSVSRWDKVALVWKSGEGKTTLISLILWLLDGYTGSIFYNGKELKWQLWSDLFSYVPQDTKIFNDTIRFNLTLWEDYSDSELLLILQKVGLGYLHSRQSKDKSLLDIHVWASWLKLSWGERQRIWIARALIRERDIYIFDEITSNLDEATEKSILDLVSELTQNNTCIFITHRKSILKTVDKIYEIKKWKLKLLS